MGESIARLDVLAWLQLILSNSSCLALGVCGSKRPMKIAVASVDLTTDRSNSPEISIRWRSRRWLVKTELTSTVRPDTHELRVTGALTSCNKHDVTVR
jgi:CBS-domain-containing membrane protein